MSTLRMTRLLPANLLPADRRDRRVLLLRRNVRRWLGCGGRTSPILRDDVVGALGIERVAAAGVHQVRRIGRQDAEIALPGAAEIGMLHVVRVVARRRAPIAALRQFGGIAL